MQDDMNTTRNLLAADRGLNTQRSIRENLPEELIRRRNDLYRVAHDVRMKSKGASAEVQHTRRMLEREVMRFAEALGQAVERTHQELMEAGDDLHMRYQKLTNQIAFPSN